MRLLSISLTLLLSLYCSTTSFAAAKPKNNYISRYLDIAIMEKERSGIPISIILGQGIFESGWGNGSLAMDANNHFGIKCGKYWNGLSYAHKDDDYDADGNLIESCFRFYDSPEHSYIDHTDFLMSGERYEFLFGLENNDYRAWAFGLKKAGYATDSLYAQKLIRIIEQYELYKYDGLTAPIQVKETPFAENQFETPSQKIQRIEPLAQNELFEMESDKISQEQAVENIKVEEYNPPKAERIPDAYFPINRKKFDTFFKNIRKKVTSNNTETLDEITPKEEEFKARGINEEKKFVIVNERKINK